ncbi:hypothetical protein WJX73_007133 [Symbiochloris irregularis]|uniref:GATA-type domain-containing protein n=1 Tax=Symbiochloris irregularis TaxID=706552 RepID=A0AAW1NYA7_9CHLO
MPDRRLWDSVLSMAKIVGALACVKSPYHQEECASNADPSLLETRSALGSDGLPTVTFERARTVTAALARTHMQGLLVPPMLPAGGHSFLFQYPVQEAKKACAQCGTTSTPQWREGPDGPKTLCNACGVKRCRQVRVAQEGKASKTSKAGSKNSKKASAAKVKPDWEPAKRMRINDDLVDNSYRPSRPRTPELETPTCSSNLGRPMRKAAARAASRTAEYAAHGEWHDESVSRARNECQLMTAIPEPPVAESADSIGRSSATAEELTFHPSPAPSAAEAVSPLTAIDHDSTAAINLMAMSLRSPQDYSKQVRSANASNGHQSFLEGATLDELQCHAEALLEQEGLPDGKRAQLQELLAALEEKDQQAVHADIAVCAVAKVLAAKQLGSASHWKHV